MNDIIFKFFLFIPFTIIVSCGPAYLPNAYDIENNWKRSVAQQPSSPHIISYSGNSRVDRVAGILLKSSGLRGVTLKVQNDNIWNASMNSINKILTVHSGLLNTTPSDTELAAVIAHEIGNGLYNHSQVQLQNLQTKQSLSNLISSQSSTQSKAASRQQIALLAADMLLFKPMTRKGENEADAISVLLLDAAGFDISAPISVWWKKLFESSGNNNYNVLSTHPVNADRIINLMRTIAVFKQRN